MTLFRPLNSYDPEEKIQVLKKLINKVEFMKMTYSSVKFLRMKRAPLDVEEV